MKAPPGGAGPTSDGPLGLHNLDPSGAEISGIVDTHFHLWDLSHPTLRYPWLGHDAEHPMLGPVEPLKRTHSIAEYVATAEAAGVSKGVHVQCADPHPDPVAESAWLSELADRWGFPHALVAYADLGDPDVTTVLSRHAGYPRVRGIRDLNPSALAGAAPSRRLGPLAEFGFHYELRAVVHDADQTDAAVAMCRANQDIPIVLTHAGLPLDRSTSYLQQWCSQLRRLGQLENVVCKASGFGMGDYLTRSRCAPSTVRDLLVACIDAFGPDRVMLGSNWPVDTLSCGYSETMASYAAALKSLNPAERKAVTSGTATRVYRLAFPS